MADSILSITVRDKRDPCSPYRSSRHSFEVTIVTCCGTPLMWKGNAYRDFPLTEEGPGGGRIHGQVPVPPGCYLVRAEAGCNNVVTDWAWVNVGCDDTVCVDLVPPGVLHCIKRAVAGIAAGTVGDQPVQAVLGDRAGRAVEQLRGLADELAEQFPDEAEGLPDPPYTPRDLEKLLGND